MAFADSNNWLLLYRIEQSAFFINKPREFVTGLLSVPRLLCHSVSQPMAV
jgi:hypothetical protein